MILLLLWGLVGIVLGFEAARHGVVQLVVPVAYAVALFFWGVVQIILSIRVSHREPRKMPSPEQVRRAWESIQKRPAAPGEPPRSEL